jgi:hypothetical protein
MGQQIRVNRSQQRRVCSEVGSGCGRSSRPTFEWLRSLFKPHQKAVPLDALELSHFFNRPSAMQLRSKSWPGGMESDRAVPFGFFYTFEGPEILIRSGRFETLATRRQLELQYSSSSGTGRLIPTSKPPQSPKWHDEVGK